MKCWSRNDPLFAAIVLNSSTPHTFSVFKYFALALLCPRESWSPTSTASRSRRRCRRKPVLPSALCVHSTHSRIQSSPHDSVPPHASLHRCCRELHHPDTICPRLCHDSKAAQPSSTTHSCPSSPKSLHRILTHVILTPNSASPAYSTQNKPVTVPSRYYIRPVSGLPASCTPAHLHAHASLRVLNISNLTTILSQQQLRGQSPVHEARLVLALLSAPVKARCQKPTLAMRDLVTTRTLLPCYTD